MLRIVFVSNYINHHQLPVSQRLASKEDVDYTFIQTEKMEKERTTMGWGVDLADCPFVKCFYEEEQYCRQLIMDADVVIFGGTDDESYIIPRLESGKRVIRYSERIYKEGQWKFISPKGLKKKYHDHVRFNKSPVYLLCSGAYVASDFNLIHAYPGKKLIWGYFPAIYDYSQQQLFSAKSESGRINILWSGRMIDWKHPEQALLVARALKGRGVDFKLTMIGDGPLRQSLESRAREEDLLERVDFIGFVKPSEVREKMLASDIYLFTSDFKEGWGAVLNESMNSGCAVIASAGIGATPYLIRDGINGFSYKTGDIDELISKCLILVDDADKRRELGTAAYETVRNIWNPENAADRLYTFIKDFVKGEEKAFSDGGPLSLAPNISLSKGYSYTKRK